MACSLPETSIVTGPPKGRRASHGHEASGQQVELGEVPEEASVPVGNPLDRRGLARRERVEGPELRALDVQRRVWNGITVRVVGGIPECLIDPRLELLRDDVLEPVGLVVHGVDPEAQGLCQVLLQEAVVSDYLEGDLPAGLGELDPLVGSMVGQPEGGELLQHRGHGRGGDPHAT